MLAATAAGARYKTSSDITLQPSCLCTHSPCCDEHSCSMSWSSSIREPSPMLAPQQQMKSSPSAVFPLTLCSRAVLSEEGCSKGPFTVDIVLIVTTLSWSLSFFPFLCAVRSWCAGCCCTTRGLRVCYVHPLPLIKKI